MPVGTLVIAGTLLKDALHDVLDIVQRHLLGRLRFSDERRKNFILELIRFEGTQVIAPFVTRDQARIDGVVAVVDVSCLAIRVLTLFLSNIAVWVDDMDEWNCWHTAFRHHYRICQFLAVAHRWAR